jgi:hypothetical protein
VIRSRLWCLSRGTSCSTVCSRYSVGNRSFCPANQCFNSSAQLRRFKPDMFVERSSIITIIHHSLCSSIPFTLAYSGRKKARVLTIVAATPARAASPPSKKPAKSTTQKLEQSCLCRHRSKYLDSHLSAYNHSFGPSTWRLPKMEPSSQTQAASSPSAVLQTYPQK